EWETATRYVPPLLAFAVGVIMACWLRWAAPLRAARISTLAEITFLFIVAILHNRLPEVAGTLGLSLVAAFQTVSFSARRGNELQLRHGEQQFSPDHRRPLCRRHRKCRSKAAAPALCVWGDVHRLWRRRGHWSICDGDHACLQPRRSRDAAADRAAGLREGTGSRRRIAASLI